MLGGIHAFYVGDVLLGGAVSAACEGTVDACDVLVFCSIRSSVMQ